MLLCLFHLYPLDLRNFQNLNSHDLLNQEPVEYLYKHLNPLYAQFHIDQ